MNKKPIAIFGCLFFILIILIILKVCLNSGANGITDIAYDESGNVIDTSTDQFEDIKDLFAILNISYEKGVKSKENNFIYDFYVTFNTPLNIENQKKYINYINNIGAQIDYHNYRLIDKINNIKIEVYSDDENKTIEKYIINDDENYFKTLNNKKEIEGYVPTAIVEVTIESSNLKELIDTNWTITENFENEDEYITYAAGYKIKIIDNKVFNIVYNDNYDESVVSGIKPSETFDKVKETLGEPAFVNSSNTIIGYKTDDFYIFFTEEDISIYRVDKVEDNVLSEAIKKIIQNDDESEFTDYLFSNWKDYDSYNEYKGLKDISYTLKGIEIQNQISLKDNIVIYSNYEGIVNNNKKLNDISVEDVPDNITLDLSTNSIFEYEKQRYELKHIEGNK